MAKGWWLPSEKPLVADPAEPGSFDRSQVKFPDTRRFDFLTFVPIMENSVVREAETACSLNSKKITIASHKRSDACFSELPGRNNRCAMQIIRIIVFGTIGFFLGIGILYLHEAGFFEAWQKEAAPPNDMQAYFSGARNQDNSAGGTITNHCDYSLPEFSFISNHPAKIVACAQVTQLYPEAIGRHTFVRDGNGDIWDWSYMSYMSLGEVVSWPSVGIIFGIIVALSSSEPEPAGPLAPDEPTS